LVSSGLGLGLRAFLYIRALRATLGPGSCRALFSLRLGKRGGAEGEGRGGAARGGAAPTRSRGAGILSPRLAPLLFRSQRGTIIGSGVGTWPGVYRGWDGDALLPAEGACGVVHARHGLRIPECVACLRVRLVLASRGAMRIGCGWPGLEQAECVCGFVCAGHPSTYLPIRRQNSGCAT
jgi:hypothetical protein